MGGPRMSQPIDFPVLLQPFFTKRLIAQRRASPHTIASYRDRFRLLLQFAHKELGKPASQITLEDLNATFIGAFLDDLERDRRNGVRSRNLRMTVIRSFFRYATFEAPQYSGLIQRVLDARRVDCSGPGRGKARRSRRRAFGPRPQHLHRPSGTTRVEARIG